MPQPINAGQILNKEPIQNKEPNKPQVSHQNHPPRPLDRGTTGEHIGWADRSVARSWMSQALMQRPAPSPLQHPHAAAIPEFSNYTLPKHHLPPLQPRPRITSLPHENEMPRIRPGPWRDGPLSQRKRTPDTQGLNGSIPTSNSPHLVFGVTPIPRAQTGSGPSSAPFPRLPPQSSPRVTLNRSPLPPAPESDPSTRLVPHVNGLHTQLDEPIVSVRTEKAPPSRQNGKTPAPNPISASKTIRGDPKHMSPEEIRQMWIAAHDPVKFDSYIYGELNRPNRPGDPLFGLPKPLLPLPSRPKPPGTQFSCMNPLVHYTYQRSRQWHLEKEEEIRSRGNRKAKTRLEQISSAPKARVSVSREVEYDDNKVNSGDDENDVNNIGSSRGDVLSKAQKNEMPQSVKANPLWLAALAELDAMTAETDCDPTITTNIKPSLTKPTENAEKWTGYTSRTTQSESKPGDQDMDDMDATLDCEMESDPVIDLDSDMDMNADNADVGSDWTPGLYYDSLEDEVDYIAKY
ncbi:hypothetical protein F5Y15DRAFT_419862 [Xylariaceae sp. FL0016]|nr:hypothetical protein F5Y15DRAFT_419862 [Xylariaceae sp. FL0016]